MKRASDYPDLDEKQALRVSPSTMLRKRPPTNKFLQTKLPNMIWDHSQQMAIRPDNSPNAIVEATQVFQGGAYRTTNKSGKPFALGVEIGGAPDARGMPFDKPAKNRMTK